MSEELYHYGTPRHSGRYPWGSGENPYQSDPGHFSAALNKMRKEGLSDVEIARRMGISTTTLRARRSVSKDQLRAQRAAQALRLKDKGYSNSKIAEMLGLPNESSVRALLKPAAMRRADITLKVADALKDTLTKNPYLDVGVNSELFLGVSKTKLGTALKVLEDQGYNVYSLKVNQLGTGNKTTMKILCPPGTEYMDLVNNRDKITMITGHKFEDGGITDRGIKPPVSVDPNRVAIRYAEDGGKDMDGVIQLRRGVEDISLGKSRYAQVRILVGEDRYLKGMAMYSDDLPDGVDLLFNTNKSKSVPKMEVLKGTKDDENNPFGATVSQRDYIGSDGKKHQSAINIVYEEGDWRDWKKKISSQVLSKQPVPLAKKQLELDYAMKKSEYDEIMSLTNPVVRSRLLQSFAEDCDSSAVHLKVVGFKNQASHVILPFPDMKETEVYAPNYKNGDMVVLIRYPHAGQFEIPTLKVNNKAQSPKDIIGDAVDAIGIHPKVAERLSGADFDGDSVLVIPNKSGAIKTAPALAKLKDFDPKDYYPAYDGMSVVGKGDGFHKQTEMGKVSNLITDMTIKGATPDELAAAVRHSMVVIDAEKHNLNWKQSYIDNGIANLKRKYLGGANKGASTLISRAKSPVYIEQRAPLAYQKVTETSKSSGIDPLTGKKVWKITGETYEEKKQNPTTGEWEKTGVIKKRLTKTTQMAETDDARTLSSGTPIEEAYATYANRMKALGNQARKDYLSTPSQKYSPEAKKKYAEEVESLDRKLNVAKMNSPLERLAQAQANLIVSATLKDNPQIKEDKDDFSKLKSQALNAARARVGAKKQSVKITDKEWEAIQAGAISHNKLSEILNNTDLDLVKKLATPKISSGLSSADLSRAKAMLRYGYTQKEVADQLGVSVSTISKIVIPSKK